jgi:hypothetical protein
MKRWTKWVVPVASLALVFSLYAANSRADDAATVTPNGKAKVTVTVVDAAGKPVAGATVGIIVPHNKKEQGAATTQPEGAIKKRPTPIESGVSSADGTFDLTKIPDGDFVVTARLSGTGNGREKITVTDGKDQTVTVTLKAPKAKNTN